LSIEVRELELERSIARYAGEVACRALRVDLDRWSASAALLTGLPVVRTASIRTGRPSRAAWPRRSARGRDGGSASRARSIHDEPRPRARAVLEARATAAGFERRFAGAVFNEAAFRVPFGPSAASVLATLRCQTIVGGLDLGR